MNCVIFAMKICMVNDMFFDVYREVDTLELVAIIKADSLEDAKEKALKMGYGKNYRIEESEE